MCKFDVLKSFPPAGFRWSASPAVHSEDILMAQAPSGDGLDRKPPYYHELSPSEAFEQIENARRAGVPIVPLIGAGLSSESGIPTTDMLIDYFSKVKALIDVKRHRQRQRQHGTSAAAPDDHSASPTIYHDYLLAAGWPDRQQLNTELLTEAQCAGTRHARRRWIGPGSSRRISPSQRATRWGASVSR